MNKPIISKMYEEKLYRTSVQEVDDTEYWQQIKKGERVGLEALYLKYTQELFRLGMSIKGNRSLVKDCIQEVFLIFGNTVIRSKIPIMSNFTFSSV